MKVIYSIKVHRDNLKTLQGLKCLQSVDVGEDGKSITCQFKDNKTRGCLIAHTNDWLVEFATGWRMAEVWRCCLPTTSLESE